MKTKEEYEQFIKERFNSRAKELLLRNVELYYQENVEIKKNKYIVGDDVFLKKGAFIHQTHIIILKFLILCVIMVLSVVTLMVDLQ